MNFNPGDSRQAALFIDSLIKDFIASSDENNLGPPFDEKIFDQPLVGFSSGDDPLYREYKRHIGTFYLSPLELFLSAFPAKEMRPSDLTVISWILPSSKAIRTEQAKRTKQPSRRWAHTRAMGEDCNIRLREYVVSRLNKKGVSALAPMLSSSWKRVDVGPYAPCSNWSERHAAYAAGLGTFGLCDGLITAVGKAVRVGSVIAAIEVEPTPRPYDDHHAYCLFYQDGSCGKCIKRCPVEALSEKGHDKKRCMQYTEHSMNRYIKQKFDLNTYACGLCQAEVPCTYSIPDKIIESDN